MRLRNLFIAFAAAFATVLAIVYGAPNAANAPDAAEAPQKRSEAKQSDTLANLPSVSVVAAGPGTVTDIVLASGLVSHVEQVAVAPQVEGQAIEKLHMQVGETVKAGDLLASLSESTLRLKESQALASRAAAEAGIAQARAQESEAQTMADDAARTRERTESLAARGLAAKAGAEQAAASAGAAQARVSAARQGRLNAEAQLKLAEAQLADVQLQLSRTAIRAPVGGVVVERNAQVGAIASAGGQPMFVILRDGMLELRADIAEQDVLRLRPGMSASLRVAGGAGRIGGAISLVEPSVNAQTRLGRVRIAINDPAQVRWGMFADAEITVLSKNALVLPASAVAGDGEKAVVLKVADGLVAETRVVAGVRDKDKIEILSGIVAGDLVVARAGAFVRDGDRIRPVVAANPAAATN